MIQDSIRFYLIMVSMVLVFTMISISCVKEKIIVMTPEQAKIAQAKQIIYEGNWIIKEAHVYEFQYKGHTYMSNSVRDGISAWHAGHCKCNKR